MYVKRFFITAAMPVMIYTLAYLGLILLLGAPVMGLALGLPVMAVAGVVMALVEWAETEQVCRCNTAHPDDPTPCPACLPAWSCIRFEVENLYMRMVHGRTCVCGEH